MNNNNNPITNSKESNKVNGTYNQAAGAVKETAGKVFGNEKLQSEGTAQNISGKSEKVLGNVKEGFQKGVHAAGDAIERVGEKLSEKGFDKAGAAIRKAGDKLEHSAD